MAEWRREDEEWQASALSAEDRVAAIVAANAASACTGRPLVYVNVMNHLMAPFCTNPHLAHVVHSAYPLFAGDRAVAEAFAQLAVRYKWTCFSFVPNALYSPLKRDLREERALWTRLHHSHLLEGRHREGGQTDSPAQRPSDGGS